MIIKFQIIKGVVMEAVKAATYLKGKMDRSVNPDATKVAFNEEAGDDEVHERALQRHFDVAMEMLKTIFADYLVPTAQTIGDNAISYTLDSSGIVEFTLNVSRRYNGTLTDALARLSARLAEDFMLCQWWTALGLANQAEPYRAAVASDEIAVRKCFILSAPSVPRCPYSSHITVHTDGESTEGSLSLEKGEDITVSYSLDDGAIDDIEARSDSPSVLAVHRNHLRSSFCLVGVNTGIATVRLFSRHNDNVFFDITVIVTEEEGYGG